MSYYYVRVMNKTNFYFALIHPQFTMGSDDESEKREKEDVKTRQPSATSKVEPTGHCGCKNNYKCPNCPRPTDHKKLKLKCPNCLEEIETKRKYKSGEFSSKVCCNYCVLTTFGLLLPCSWIPFCSKNYKDVYHKCPLCKHKLTKWDRDYCMCGGIDCFRDIDQYGCCGKV